MIILLDAMGGDNAPDANIKGAVAAINQINAELWLIGKEDVIKSRVKKLYNKDSRPSRFLVELEKRQEERSAEDGK